MKTIKFLSMLMLTGLVFTSCSDDDENPDPINEEEVITTVNVTLEDPDGNEYTMQFRDLDGIDGPDSPVIEVDDLIANTTYTGTIEVLNESEEEVEDVTVEIENEDEEHQFIFEFSGAVENVEPTDSDDDGNPVGLEFELSTTDAGSATLGVFLRHEPTKPNDGTLEGAGGETDIDAVFSFNVVDE